MKRAMTITTLLLATSGVANAEPTAKVTKVAKNRHVRMSAELATIFAVGHQWYWRDNGEPNRVDWQLPWDSGALGAKTRGADGWRFDGNDFNINSIGHPGFGMLTHVLAREN